MSVFMVCEMAIGLLRGNRLILTPEQRNWLEALNYESLANGATQDEAVSCARHFAEVRDRMLQSHPWVFARKSASLAELSTTLSGWPHAYAVPADCLRVLTLLRHSHSHHEHGRRTVEKWERVGSAVGCFYENVEMRYTARIAATEQWDPLFTDAFIYSLAAAMTASVTGEASVWQSMEQGAQLRVQTAQSAGAIKMPLDVEVEAYGWHGFSDRLDPRYDDSSHGGWL